MNPKTRALVWEECRVGGVVSLWCLAAGLANLLILRFDMHGQWTFVGTSVLLCALGTPLLASFLLVLRTGNSGHLTSGFSSRLLLLPVDTRHVTWLVLSMRLIFIVLLSSTMTALSYLLYTKSPGAAGILLAVTAYLAIQFTDWLRKPAPLLSFLCLLLLAGSVIWMSLSWGYEEDTFLHRQSVRLLASPWFAILVLCAVYGLSPWAVGAARKGTRLHTKVSLRPPEVLPVPEWMQPQRFHSPWTALLWFEFRTKAFTYPLYAAAVWIGLLALTAGIGWAAGADADGSMLFAFEIAPFVAVIFAAPIVGGLRNGGGWRKKARPSLFHSLHPIPAAQMATAQLTAFGLALALGCAAATLLSVGHFLFGHEGICLGVIRESMAAGEANLRELLGYLLGTPIVIGLVAWALLSGGTRTVQGGVAACLVTLVGVVAVELMGVPLISENPASSIVEFFSYLLSSVFLLVLTLAALAWCFLRRTMPRRHLVGCLGVWAAVAAFFYPFGQTEVMDLDRLSLLVALAFGALAVLPYPALLIDLHRRRHGVGAVADAKQHAAYFRPPVSPVRRGAWTMGLLALLLFFTWLRWPAEPVYIQALHARGLPVTRAELNAAYPEVPNEENAALKYLAAAKSLHDREKRWTAALVKKFGGTTNRDYIDFMDTCLPSDHITLSRTELVPKKVWEATLERHTHVEAPVAETLRAIARQDTTRSRYPGIVGTVLSEMSSALAETKYLSRTLGSDAYVAAIEGRTPVSVEDILALVALAASLEPGPTQEFQSLRLSYLSQAAATLEQVMNRASFDEESLHRVQDAFLHALPPLEERPVMNTSGEIACALVVIQKLNNSMKSGFPTPKNLHSVLRTGWFGQAVVIRAADPTARAKDHRPGKDDELDPIMEAAGLRGIYAWYALPRIEWAANSEWQCRLSLKIAATACAAERFRIARGILPERLGDLVPEFLDKVPEDPFRVTPPVFHSGQPLSYRVKDNGEFVVYSWAMNGKDDVGDEPDLGKRANPSYNYDLTFTVAPPEVRDRPQVAEAEQPGASSPQ